MTREVLYLRHTRRETMFFFREEIDNLGGLNCPGGVGGVCEMKAIHGVKKMVNYYPLIAHSAQRMKFFAEIMPHIVQLDHFTCN